MRSDKLLKQCTSDCLFKVKKVKRCWLRRGSKLDAGLNSSGKQNGRRRVDDRCSELFHILLDCTVCAWTGRMKCLTFMAPKKKSSDLFHHQSMAKAGKFEHLTEVTGSGQFAWCKLK